MKNWKIVAGLLIVFISGLAVGVVGSLLYFKSNMIKILGGDYHLITRAIERRLDAKLDLNPQQQQAIHRIIQSAQQELIVLREKWRPQADQIVFQNVAKIKQVLDPKQITQLDIMISKFKRLRENMNKNKFKNENPPSPH